MKTITLLLLLSFASFILVFIWFKDGYLLGTAESQLFFYNLTHFYDQVKLAWSDTNPGLGFANNFVTAYAPTFFVFSLLEKMGLPNYMIQGLFFWILFCTSGLGMILLTQELFPKISQRYLLIAALFYWFNLISLVNIWNRFLYNYMSLWALLPIASYLYFKGINRHNYLYIFPLGIICSIFSLGLSSPVFNIILFFVFFYITIFKILTANAKGVRLFFVSFFILNLVYFCLVNLWWIGQIVRSIFLDKYTKEISSIYKNVDTITTLNSLSKTLGDINYLFRLSHKTFFTLPFIEWAKIFNSPVFVLIEFLIIGVILFLIIEKKRNINVLFLGCLLFLSIFLAKGSNPPFGKLFETLFILLPPLQLFRNPFEKFGFIIPLATAPLLAIGIENLSFKLKKRLRIPVSLLFLIIIIGLFGYPFWSGLVFTNTSPPTNNYSIGYKVKVPEYYSIANNWLDSQGQNFRFIGFPLKDQGVTYLWEKGYQGVETSTWLFSTPHIMFSTPILYFNDIADQLEQTFLQNKDFYKVMNVLNAKFLMVRSDIDFHERNMRNPNRLSDVANEYTKDNKLVKSLDFNNLSFWENPFWQDKTVYATTSLFNASPQIKLSDFSLPELTSADTAYQGNLSYLARMTNIEIIHPQLPKNTTNNSLIYEFDIENFGDYELFANLPITRIDKDKIESKSIKKLSDKYTFGTFKLSKGHHTLEILSKSEENLAKPNMNLNHYTVSDFDPFAKYEVSFEYNMSEDNRKKLTVLQDNEQIRNSQPTPFYVRDLTPTSSNSFNSYKDTLEPRNTASSMEIYFSPEPSSDIIIKNMSIRNIINPSITLIRKIESNLQKKPELTYIKISPTKYIIHIKNSQNPFSLIFSSTFSTGWEIAYPDGMKVKNHFLANSFANGWLIERTGDYDLTLNFSLQEGLDWDNLISIISLTIGVLIILLGLITHKFNEPVS